jgi:hypothetical protein
MLRKSVITVITSIGVLLFLLISLKVYVIRGTGGGALYWNADEALLFIAENNYGARMSALRYIAEPFLLSLGDVRAPDDTRCRKTLVVGITDKDVHVYDTDLYRYGGENGCQFQAERFAGNFYEVAWPKLWKWSDTRFDRPTPQEYGAYAEALFAGKTVLQHPWEFDNVNGWSMRGFGQTGPTYQFTLNGQPVTILFHGETSHAEPLSVDLIRPGQAPQKIWSFDVRPHRVSKSEYETAFRLN